MGLFTWIRRNQYGLPNLGHYVDDFIYAAPAETAQSSFSEFQAVAATFGIPFKLLKFVPPTPVIE